MLSEKKRSVSFGNEAVKKLFICNISNAVLFFFGISLSVLFSKLYGTTGVGLGMCIGTALAILVLCIHFFEIKCIFKFKWHLSWTVLRLTLPMQIRI